MSKKLTETTADAIKKEDYVALASFRYTLRRFLHITEEAARAVGLTPQQHQLLLAIKGQPGKEWAWIAEIAHALQVTHHAAVRLVDRCVQAELVTRSSDPDDRRQVRVTLTVQGEAVLAQLSQRNRRELQALRQALQLSFLDGSARVTRQE